MEKITFKVEAITPIFIAGADQKIINNEGLRAPSLKGLMRWWFRAIMGGMIPLRHLKILESQLYGDTNQRSKIKIFSKTNASPSNINIHRDLRYLWFSIYLQRKKEERLQCYPPKSEFKIILLSDDSLSLKITTACLWLIIFLGGIGSRMRRGAGSLKVISLSNRTTYDFIFKGKTLDDLKEFITKNLNKIFKDFQDYAGNKFNPKNHPNFAILSRDTAKIALVSQVFNDWKECLKKISDLYQIFRRQKSPYDRYTFGLPIINYRRFRDLRHASPLLFGVFELNGKYTVRIIKFFSSIHKDFISNLRFLKRDLNELNISIAKDNNLGELQIEIPEI